MTFTQCSRPGITAKQGILDLSSANLSKPAKLDGEWEFYWQQLVTEGGENPKFIQLPRTWTGMDAGEGKLGADGYASMVLRVKLPENADDLAIHFPDLSTSYRVYVDGEERLNVGVVSSDPTKAEPTFQSGTIELKPNSDEVQIVVQISNFSYYKGGFWKSAYIGTTEAVHNRIAWERFQGAFLFGSLLMMSLFFLFFFVLRRGEYAALYFGGFCFFMAARALLIDARLLSLAFPFIPWRVLIASEFISIFVGFPLFFSFFNDLYKGIFYSWILIAYNVICAVFNTLVIATSPKFYGQFTLPMQVLSLSVGVYFLSMLVRQAFRGDRSVVFNLAGFAILLSAGMHDFLVSRELIASTNVLPFGLFLFVLSQAFVMSLRYTLALRNEEEAHTSLSVLTDSYRRFLPETFLTLLGKENIQEVQIGDHVEGSMTIFFLDIRDFTTLSESMPSGDMFELLNAHWKRVNPVIQKHGGFVDKFIGDAVMAIFPGPGQGAVRAAVEIKKLVDQNNEFRINSGYNPLRIGIGIHYGNLTLGTVGESKRMETTVIGDTVNLAARIESLTKKYFISILISDAVYRSLESPEEFHLREIDHVTVKGKTKPIVVYECYDTDLPQTIVAKDASRAALMLGLSMMSAGDYSEALTSLIESQRLCRSDPIPVIQISRCQNKLMMQKKRLLVKDRTQQPAVLIVDDNMAIQKLWQKSLEKIDVRVELASTAEAAYLSAGNIRPDLCLVDLQLPDGDGFEVIGKIREALRNSDHEPIFVIASGEDSREAILKSLEYGVEDFLIKPIDPRMLVDVVKRRLMLDDGRFL